MAMVLLTSILALIAVFSVHKSTAADLGICIETCSTSPDNSESFDKCPEGYECKSTGCGHTCQLAPQETKTDRGACVIACSPVPGLGFPSCQEGYVCKPNGCGVTCQIDPQQTKAKRGACIIACSPVQLLQEFGLPTCQEGYVCKSNGCGMTCQAEVDLSKRQRCAPVLCDMYCINGWALDEHECEICKCKEV